VKSLLDHLSTYAEYHRDRRNIATHFVGVPMIVVAIEGLLARSSLPVGPVSVSPALLVTAGVVAFYVALDRRYGLAMAGLLGVALAAGARLAALPTGPWLAGSIGLFVVGWAAQFLGHAFEGRKPAFVDDLVGLAIGPLFVAAEAGFALGLREEVREAVERHAGPTRKRRPVTA
jgi:uncharacterized membrane protein YGL010W